MMQRLTFPFPFVHHQTHDWLLSVLEWHLFLCSSQKERGLMNVVWKCIQLVNVWKVEQLLTVETRTYSKMICILLHVSFPGLQDSNLQEEKEIQEKIMCNLLFLCNCR